MNMSCCLDLRSRFATARFFVAIAALCAARLAAVPAFPGAEGFGANASGARGGSVYHVTNLNDSGTGSFRDAVSVSGRTVVFDVGGIIVANSPLVVKSNITIAGQTAPGEGVTIYGDRLSYSGANNVITRYIRYREGINGDSGTDAVGADSGDTMMFDHVSASWGRDETFSLSGTPSNITLQDCIIGEGLLIHSAGSLMQTSGGVSIFRTLYTDNWMRNPKIKGVNDYQNNVVYNWGSGGGYIPAGDSAGLSYANMINCYFIAGPNTGSEGPFKTGNTNYSLYHSGNYQDLNINGLLDGVAVTDASFPTLNLVSTPFDYPKPATLLSAQDAYSFVMANAGASLHRDHADQYMIAELASLGTSGAQIFNESEIGGVGTVAGGVALADTDGDGIPDAWESAMGTNPAVADNNGDINGDGYTNLENYLNALAPAGVQVATVDGIVNDSGSSASDGVTSDTSLLVRGTAPAGSVVTVYRLDTGAIGTATADGSGNWVFDYTGTMLTDRFYAFYATVDLGDGKVSPPTRAFLVKVDTTPATAPTITSIVSSPSFSFIGTAEPGALVQVTRVGDGIVGSATADALGNWTAVYSGPALPGGTYSFTAAATDLAGNAGPSSAPYTVNTALAAPVFTGIVNDSGTAGDRITNDTTLILNGTSFAGAIVSVYRDGNATAIGTATANASGVWTLDTTGTALTAGTHTFTATASNGSSSSPVSTPFVVTIDTTKPTISSIKRFNPTTSATTDSSVVFRVTFAEAVNGVDAGDFTLTLGGSATGAISSLVQSGTGIYDVTVTGVGGDGTIRLDLKSSGTGITDVAANAISGGFTSGQTYTIRLPGSGVWISDVSGELYSTTADWQNGLVPSGTGITADFAQQNIDGDFVVQLDTPRTLGRVVFGDTDWTTPAQWQLSDNGSAANALTLAGSTPTIQVDAATSPSGDTVDVPAANATPSRLDVVLSGTSGFIKNGVGTIEIVKPATISGPLTISKGIVQIGTGGSLTTSSVTISTSQQLRVAGGTFTTTGSVSWASGTGTGIIVSSGSGSFQRILPSNARNSFVKVTGGTLTATEITFPRSGDSESQALGVGIQISGGDSTVGKIGLGTDNSWGAMTISGGRMTVTGPTYVGFQVSSGRGGDVVVSGGEFNELDTSATGGLVLARNPVTDSPARTSNGNQVAKFTITGGVSNVTRIALGYDATSTAGSAIVSLTDGELNVGTGGIVKNGTSGQVTSITLNSGILGAMASWTTSHAIVANGSLSDLAIRAADHNGSPFDITLAGGVNGTGGFAKTGAGLLTLGGNSAFAGSAAVNAGTLFVAGTIGAGGDIDVSGGTLAGTGAINRGVVLDVDGTLAPAAGGTIGTLTAGNVTWNAGGQLAIDLGVSGTSDVLAVTGALSNATGGAHEIAVSPTAGVVAGATYTVATFGSTDFVDADFVVTGLPAGYAGAVTVNANSLQITILTTPSITSAASATGQYGAPFSYQITAANSPATFSAAPLPPGLSVDATTGVISGVPTAAGSYVTTVGATNLAGTGNASLAILIDKALAGVALSNLSATYDGTAHAVTVGTTPAGLNVVVTYNGNSTPPTNAGSYAVAATVVEANYYGSASDTLTIAKASQTITFPSPGTKTYGDAPFALGATASSNLPVSYAIVSGPAIVVGNTLTITGAGSVTIRASQGGNSNYLAASDVDVTFTVQKATATIVLDGLRQAYDGTPKSVTATTVPAGLTVNITYNGDSAAPTNPGTYDVVATIDDPNYSGSVSDKLVITVTALVRHAPTLNGGLDGSVQVLTGESFTLNGSAYVAGDILLLGTPAVHLNGKPTLAGIIDGTGASAPSNYSVTLNAGAVVRYLVRRTDAIALPTVEAPAAPAGTRDVVVNAASDSMGDFATVRSLTLNGNVGNVALPAGAYGDVTVNGGSGLVLGIAGATEPAVYDLQRLTLNGSATLQIAGPVVLRLANDVVLSGTVGAADQSLTIELAHGNMTLNSGANVYAEVLAPAGAVSINGNATLHGRVSADGLTINGGGLLDETTP